MVSKPILGYFSDVSLKSKVNDCYHPVGFQARAGASVGSIEGKGMKESPFKL